MTEAALCNDYRENVGVGLNPGCHAGWVTLYVASKPPVSPKFVERIKRDNEVLKLASVLVGS